MGDNKPNDTLVDDNVGEGEASKTEAPVEKPTLAEIPQTGKVWMRGIAIKAHFDGIGEVDRDKYYLVDLDEKKIDWDYINKIKNTEGLPTYNDILKQLDIDIIDIPATLNPICIGYKAMLKLYALSRKISAENLLKKLGD